MEDRQIDWQAPPFTASPETRMGWIEEQIQESEGWMEGQSAYKHLGRNLRVFDGIFKDTSKSTLVTNSLKYNIRKFVETLAEVREIALYGSDAPQFKKIAEMVNKVCRATYLESDFPFQMLKVLQYASVMGVGYLWPKCKAADYGWGERQLVFEALGLLDVMPVQVPSTNDVQDAYNVTVYEYMPIAEAHARFPAFQSDLKPVDRGQSKRSIIQAKRVDHAERYRYGDSRRNFGNLYCEIRYTFVKDLAVNRYDKELPMGDLDTTWFYKVPFVGQDIPGGVRDAARVMRKAKPEDCRIYPNLRLMISSAGMTRPMYDGPNFDWSGVIPTVQYTVDDWAWEPVGRSLVGDVASIETTKRKIERKMDQVITTTLNPPLGYDRSSTGGPKIENFDIFEENLRAGMDGKPTEVLQSLLPEEVRVTDVHFKFLEYLDTAQKQQLGLVDLGNLQNMKMNIASDQADKMLESIGPLAKGIAARIEKGNKRVGYQMKFLVLQYYDTKRIMEYISSADMAPEVFDFDPASLVPSHLPDEMNGTFFPETPSVYDKLQRARWFARNIRLISSPNTLLRITQMQEQLKFLQLKRGNAPISWATVMKKLDVPNYGEVDGTTEREKYFNEEMEMTKMKIVAQAQAMQLMQQLGLNQPGAEGDGKKGGGHAGRKPSGQKPPQIKQKGGAGGAPRTTVTES